MIIDRIKALCQRILKTERCIRTLTLSCCGGIYMAFCPFVGKTFLILFMSPLLRLNPSVVLITCTIIYNPWSAIPVYLFGYWLGQWLLDGVDVVAWDPSWLHSFTRSLGLSKINLLPLLVGCNVLGIVLACALYPIIRWGFGRYLAHDPAT
jgi:uncharacterized protein (DUF2062 family)